MSRRPNVATLRSYDGQLASANVTTSSGLTQREFFRYNKKNDKREGGDTRQRRLHRSDSRDHVSPVICIFFLELPLIKN